MYPPTRDELVRHARTHVPTTSIPFDQARREVCSVQYSYLNTLDRVRAICCPHATRDRSDVSVRRQTENVVTILGGAAVRGSSACKLAVVLSDVADVHMRQLAGKRAVLKEMNLMGVPLDLSGVGFHATEASYLLRELADLDHCGTLLQRAINSALGGRTAATEDAPSAAASRAYNTLSAERKVQLREEVRKALFVEEHKTLSGLRMSDPQIEAMRAAASNYGRPEVKDVNTPSTPIEQPSTPASASRGPYISPLLTPAAHRDVTNLDMPKRTALTFMPTSYATSLPQSSPLEVVPIGRLDSPSSTPSSTPEDVVNNIDVSEVASTEPNEENLTVEDYQANVPSNPELQDNEQIIEERTVDEPSGVDVQEFAEPTSVTDTIDSHADSAPTGDPPVDEPTNEEEVLEEGAEKVALQRDAGVSPVDVVEPITHDAADEVEDEGLIPQVSTNIEHPAEEAVDEPSPAVVSPPLPFSKRLAAYCDSLLEDELWAAHVDQGSGRQYYSNKATKKVVWDLGKEVASQFETQEVARLLNSGEWIAADNKGRTYYYHHETKVTCWDLAKWVRDS